MRIISGKHKGKKISAPKKLPVRPTTDRAKEAIFNILENRYFLDVISVLDLFSGTGNISYEFGSRGCKKITSVDQNPSCVKFIKETSENLALSIKSINSDCLKYIYSTSEKFDIIFADPPYNYENYDKLKNMIFDQNLLKENGVLILEHNNTTKFKDENVKNKRYGNVYFSIFS